MNKSILFLIAMIFPLYLFSQDLIVTKNNEFITCKITKEDSVAVYFTFMKNGKTVNTFANKSDIKKYVYNYEQDQRRYRDSIDFRSRYRSAITFGVLEGGGSLVGVDFEVSIADGLGIQAGAGFLGFGAGLDIHIKPYIRSSFVSVQYWHQGVGPTYTQSAIGACYVYRGPKWFTFEIGLAHPIEKGPAYPENRKQPAMMLTYAIGAYVPF